MNFLLKYKYTSISSLIVLLTLLSLYMFNDVIMMLLFIVALLMSFVGCIYIFKYPNMSIQVLLIFAMFFGTLSKMTEIPLGTLLDVFLLLMLIAVSVQYDINWKVLNNSIMFLIVIWCIFIVLELFNPLAPTRIAWVYAMRSIMYQLIVITMLSALLFDTKNFNIFLKIWLFVSCIAVLDGLRQKYMFPNLWAFEKHWLGSGAYAQHILFGKLRVFSFYTDAGQYGAAMGHALTSSIILTISTVKIERLLYMVVSALTVIGLFISGTRGALFVPMFGIFSYLIISKNWKVLIIGSLLASLMYYALAFTSVGSNIYEIRRMRTAVNPVEDPSFQVRLNNQKKLKIYLKDKPFGTGVGTSASFGGTFSPTFYASTIPEDSLYVRIWVETGIVGLSLYVILLMWIILKGGRLIWIMPQCKQRTYLMAVWSGFIGIVIASYGNMILNQLPTSVICYATIGYIVKCEYDYKQNKLNTIKDE